MENYSTKERKIKSSILKKRNVLDKILDNNMGEMAQFYLESEDSFNRWLDAEDY